MCYVCIYMYNMCDTLMYYTCNTNSVDHLYNFTHFYKVISDCKMSHNINMNKSYINAWVDMKLKPKEASLVI